VALNGWRNIWLEIDSTSALMSFKKDSLIPISLRNRWHNLLRLDVLHICIGKVIVVLTILLIWGISSRVRFGGVNCHRKFAGISLGTAMTFLILDSHSCFFMLFLLLLPRVLA
jgi:hypothetical protein